MNLSKIVKKLIKLLLRLLIIFVIALVISLIVFLIQTGCIYLGFSDFTSRLITYGLLGICFVLIYWNEE